jgi:hypothetical protein
VKPWRYSEARVKRYFLVMAGLDPATHVLLAATK